VLFADRADAGRRLADRLRPLAGADVVVLGLPRGGVPVAAQVARALGAPLDVILVRKLGVPHQPELAMGAIGEDGVRVLNEQVVRAGGFSARQLDETEARERRELERRARLYRGARPRVPVAGRTALIVDDGIATGSTVRAACRVARAHGAHRVIVATPVAPPGTVGALRADADEVIALHMPERFYAIGQFYGDFSQTADDDVVRLLAAAGLDARDDEVEVRAGDVTLGGHLTVPAGAEALVVFAHGSGSSRHSPRNGYVASVLHGAHLGTLLFDLLTPVEEHDRAKVFDIPLLGSRLSAVTRWTRAQPSLGDAPVGYFGASTGAGAALWAAAEPEPDVGAVVSRGGRPDLARPRLAAVRAPTLLIVGGNDQAVLELNRAAQAEMRAMTRLAVVPGASHLFEEPGTLQAAAELARDWFTEHLRPVGAQ
jgi:putative phosphoribosyl transferase